MARAKQSDTVKVHYTGKLEDGTVFDSSAEREPLEFTIGTETVIPGFEDAVVGMKPGERKVESVPAGRAYGIFQEDLVQEIDRSRFPADGELSDPQGREPARSVVAGRRGERIAARRALGQAERE